MIRSVLDFCFECPCCLAGRALFWGSIVNAVADGKRLCAIDALQRPEIVRTNGRKAA
jgi:hypothetical protein